MSTLSSNPKAARRHLVRAIDEHAPLADVRRRYVALVVATSDSVSDAARKLGVARRTIYRWLEEAA